MQSSMQRHQEGVIGVLSGFDRVLFRGTLRSISYTEDAGSIAVDAEYLFILP